MQALNAYWAVTPPLNVTTKLIALTLGIKFETGTPSASRSSALTSQAATGASPDALFAMGAVERPYVRPARGLPIGDQQDGQ